MAIDREQVRHIARLARLRFEEEELERMAEQLGRILEYFRRLQELDTAAVPPTFQTTGRENVWREEDEPREGLERDQALANAPASREGCFQVPPVIEGP